MLCKLQGESILDKNKRQTDRRTFLKHISLLTASAGMMMNARCGRSSQQGRKPNIIFILSDDLSWGDLGCYGQEKIKTPNIDRLAKEGMRFTNAYSGASGVRTIAVQSDEGTAYGACDCA